MQRTGQLSAIAEYSPVIMLVPAGPEVPITDPDLLAACTAVTFRRVRASFFMTNKHVANGAACSHRLIKWQNCRTRLTKDKVNSLGFEHPYCCFGSCHFRHNLSKLLRILRIAGLST